MGLRSGVEAQTSHCGETGRCELSSIPRLAVWLWTNRFMSLQNGSNGSQLQSYCEYEMREPTRSTRHVVGTP